MVSHRSKPKKTERAKSQISQSVARTEEGKGISLLEDDDLCRFTIPLGKARINQHPKSAHRWRPRQAPGWPPACFYFSFSFSFTAMRWLVAVFVHDIYARLGPHASTVACTKKTQAICLSRGHPPKRPPPPHPHRVTEVYRSLASTSMQTSPLASQKKTPKKSIGSQ